MGPRPQSDWGQIRAQSDSIGITWGDTGFVCAGVDNLDRGYHRYKAKAYTEKVDLWVADRRKLKPSPELLQKAVAAIDRILGEDSELCELWEGNDAWHEAMQDLRARLQT